MPPTAPLRTRVGGVESRRLHLGRGTPWPVVATSPGARGRRRGHEGGHARKESIGRTSRRLCGNDAQGMLTTECWKVVPL